MIRGIGIDTVDIARFNEWHTYPRSSLERIFAPQEIDYCVSCPLQSAERFAVRFAAREALLKALGSAYPAVNIPFLTLCRHIIIKKSAFGAPYIQVNWKQLLLPAPAPACFISLSHTKSLATAFVVLE